MSVVVFSARTGRIRRIISDLGLSDRQLRERHEWVQGEDSISMAILTSQLVNLNLLQIEISTRTGLTPTDDRYAVVDPNGSVINVIIADPDAGDSVEGHTLVVQRFARVGWRQMRDGSFQRSLAEIEQELDRIELRQSNLDSQEFRDAQAAKRLVDVTSGLSTDEINEKIRLSSVLIDSLQTERDARLARR